MNYNFFTDDLSFYPLTHDLCSFSFSNLYFSLKPSLSSVCVCVGEGVGIISICLLVM